MTHSSLPWCPGAGLRRVYKGKIRDGKFGQQTAETYEVWECATARLGYLHPFPQIDYSDESYRVSVNASAAIEQYFKLHDVHPTVEAALTQGLGGSADIALSFHVIEHVMDPVVYLSAMRRLVRPGGMAVILTPNWDDILMKVDPDRMEPFFYRRVHNYYFTAASLAWVGELAGWKPVDNIFYHEFGLANTLLWLRDGKPAGHTRCSGVDQTMDASWCEYLQQTRQANNVGIVLRNLP